MPGNLRGIVLITFATLCFASMHVLIRYAAVELHSFEIVFFRNFLGLVVLAPVFLRRGLAPLRTRRAGLHGMRAVINVVAMLAYFHALTIMPLARATSLWFSAPIFAALLAMVFLGEVFHMRRYLALAVGLAGTMVVLRPGFVAVDLGSMLSLGAAFMFGCTMVIIKMLGRTESSVTITAYMNILLALLSLAPALSVWRWPEGATWLLLLLIGIFGTMAQLAVAQSLKETDTSVIAPFHFFQLLWAALFGFLFFGERPTAFIWLGGALIVAGTSYLAYRESRVGRDRTEERTGGNSA